jgi:hypothetical protein
MSLGGCFPKFVGTVGNQCPTETELHPVGPDTAPLYKSLNFAEKQPLFYFPALHVQALVFADTHVVS